MEESIRFFFNQFAFEPVVENADRLVSASSYIVVGMGGSHLAAGLIKVYRPTIDLLIHRDYGLPRVPDSYLERSLLIFSSFSGNTEEVLDAFNEAVTRGLSVAVVASGGVLVERAKERGVPFVLLPATTRDFGGSDQALQPRSALGFSVKAILKLIGDEDALRDVSGLSHGLAAADYEEDGRKLAAAIKGSVPVIYASSVNLAVAYNWKIKFNETGKIPAFYNIVPELNHNEMTGFDRTDGTRTLSDPFHILLLTDAADHGLIQKRMRILETMYADRQLKITAVPLSGDTVWHKIFVSLTIADWTALHTALQYGVDPNEVPMVEEFKRRMA